MIDRSVKKLVLEKAKITSQALSQRAKKIKSSFGPMSTEEAVYVIAHQEGIDLSRILSIDVIDRVRSLVPKEIPKAKEIQKSTKSKRPKTLKPAQSYPLVSKRMDEGSLRLHGWWFDIKEADVYEYDLTEGRFNLIDEEYAKVLLARR